MTDEEEEGMDFISLMKKKRADRSKPSVIGEDLEKAEEASKKAEKFELDSLIYKRENEELKEKVNPFERENKSLKERMERVIKLMEDTEEKISSAMEEKEQLEFELNNQIHKLEFKIDELTKENEQLQYELSHHEQIKSDEDAKEEINQEYGE